VPQVPPPRGQGFFDDGPEKLRCLDSALAQGVEVFGHAAIGDAIEPRRVDACLPQILLQAQPRCVHLADGGNVHLGKVGKPETGIGVLADDRERITQTTSAKQTSGAELVLVVVLDDPHRPRPEHLDRAVEQGALCQSDTR
jgi:hypothetical protein